MRIKIRPVRWWRDDADRYRSRGAYTAPEQDPAVAPWALDLLNADPELLALYERADADRNRALLSWLAPETLDPIADVKRAIRSQR